MSQWPISRWRLYSIVVEAAIAWLAFYADPLGLGEQETRALSDYLAVGTQYLHGPAPKGAAVVLVDATSLRERGVDWPLPYNAVADLIGELRCARVKGVFFDFTASREFTPANPDERLRAAVEGESKTRVCADGSAPADAPVFFGRVEGFETPLGQWLRERGRTFLLAAGEDAGVYRASKDLFPAQTVPIEETTPAFGLMRTLDLRPAAAGASGNAACGDDDARSRCWRAPLSIVWSARIDPAQSQVSDLAPCRGDRGWLGTLMEMPWPWAGDDRFERCPPVLTLRAADFERDADYIEAHGDPTKPLAGRFAFVGVDLPALNDTVATPIHDHLPGVYKHAVALGELIAAGARYPTFPPPQTLALIVAAIYLGLETARQGLRRRPNRQLIFAGVYIAGVAGFSLWVYARGWPLTLIVAVFGYYSAAVTALFAAARARARADAQEGFAQEEQ
jgi:hypothetical protein